MKLRVIFSLAACFINLSAPGNETVYPPLDAVSIVGTWEALLPYDPATLWHIEMRAKGESYMAQITVGTQPVIRRLVASEVRDGVVKLHFGKGWIEGKPDQDSPELWIIGTGEGVESQGAFDAMFCGNAWPASPPPRAKLFGVPEGDHMFFRKGTWTRDLGEASRIAGKSIEKQTSK
jgi:hypothetical protein